MSGRAFVTDSIANLMELNDQSIRGAYRAARWELRDKARSMEAVALAGAQTAITASQQIDNRRLRYHPKAEARHPYRPVLGPTELLHLVLLDVLDDFEAQDRKAGEQQTGRRQILSYTRQIVKPCFIHSAFYPAVAMGHVLCDYPAPETLEIYRLATDYRPDKKNWSACSRARTMFLRNIVRHFPGLARIRKERGTNLLNWRAATETDVELIKRSLLLFFPQVSQLPVASPESVRQTRVLRLINESQPEMNLIRRILDPSNFAAFAAQASGEHPARAFDGHARVLDTFAAPDPDLDSGDGDDDLTEADIEHIRELMSRYQNRARRRAPGSLCIRVDGIDRAIIDQLHPSCTLRLEEGASIVKVLSHDEEEPIVLGSYVFSYDIAKCEQWDIDIAVFGRMSAHFDYGEDDSVLASFGLESQLGTVLTGADESSNAPNSVIENTEERRPYLVTSAYGAGKSFSMIRHLLSELRRRYSRDAVYYDSGSSTPIERSNQRSVIPYSASDELLELKHDDSEEELLIVLDGQHRITAIDLIKQIDSLSARQANIVGEFLENSKTAGLSVYNIPSIHESLDSISRISGRVALVSSIAGAGTWAFLSSGSEVLGVPLAVSLSLAAEAIAVVATGAWWKFAWSRRLYDAYHENENRIHILCAELEHRLRRRSVTASGVADWRDFPIAYTLAALLQPHSEQVPSASDSESWNANTIPERALIGVISDFGERRRARKIAREIVHVRPFSSPIALAQALGHALKMSDSVKDALVRLVASDCHGYPDQGGCADKK